MKESNAGIVGGSGGSLGEASTGDLKKGYTKQDVMLPEGYCDEGEETFISDLKEDSMEGFAGRPKGFER